MKMIGILDANSWHIILDTFQKSEALYSKFRLPKTNQEIFEKENNINSDLQILSSALDTLFTNSYQYSVLRAFIKNKNKSRLG
jgi:hypothetical protein